MYKLASVLATSGLLGLASAQGFVSSPAARQPGSAMAEACGQKAVHREKANSCENIEALMNLVSDKESHSDDACNLWLCKGQTFEDNRANVQHWTPGQKVPITVKIDAPNTGVANVSIVDTTTNTVIGDPLKVWDEYASSEKAKIPKHQKKFKVQLPNDIPNRCIQPGACVLQWYWHAKAVGKTWESCIDFTIGDALPPGSTTISTGSTNTATNTKGQDTTTCTDTPSPTETSGVSTPTNTVPPTTLTSIHVTSGSTGTEPTKMTMTTVPTSTYPSSSPSTTKPITKTSGSTTKTNTTSARTETTPTTECTTTSSTDTSPVSSPTHTSPTSSSTDKTTVVTTNTTKTKPTGTHPVPDTSTTSGTTITKPTYTVPTNTFITGTSKPTATATQTYPTKPTETYGTHPKKPTDDSSFKEILDWVLWKLEHLKKKPEPPRRHARDLFPSL